MKKVMLIIISLSALGACKKEEKSLSQTNNSNNNTPSATAWSKPSTFFDSKVVRTFCSVGTTLVVGTDDGRFKSTDNGATWSSINTGLPDSTLTYVWTDGTNLFTKKDGVSGVSSASIYKSTNSGASWTLLCNTGGLTSLRSLAFVGAKIIAASSNRIYTSSDNGANWSQAYSGNTGINISTFEYSGTNVFSTNGGNPLKSTDGGLNFSDITTTNSNFTFCTNLVINGTNLFVADRMGNNGVFKSTDNGSSWSACNTGIISAFTPMQVRTILSDNTKIYAGITNRVFSSSNSGASWNQLGADFPNSSSSNTIYPNFIIKNNGYVYAMTSAGLFKIAD